MAEYEIAYLHQGTARTAVIYAESHTEAQAQFESMAMNGVVTEEIERHDACDATVAWAQVRTEMLP